MRKLILTSQFLKPYLTTSYYGFRRASITSWNDVPDISKGTCVRVCYNLPFVCSGNTEARACTAEGLSGALLRDSLHVKSTFMGGDGISTTRRLRKVQLLHYNVKPDTNGRASDISRKNT